MSEQMEEIKDTFGPVTSSSPGVRYLSLPDGFAVHFIGDEASVEKFELLSGSDEPIGIDSEWRPSMNVFH